MHQKLQPIVWFLVALLLAACGGGGGAEPASGSPPAPPVAGLPALTAPLVDVAVVDGDAATFIVNADGATGWQWQRGMDGAWTDVPGANTARWTLATAPLALSGSQWRVVVTGPGGSIVSAPITLRVTERIIAPAIVQPPVDARVIEGQAARFSVTATGTAPDYVWQRGSDALGWTDVGVGPTFELTVARLADNGSKWRVVVRNAAGTVPSLPVTLLVDAAPITATLSLNASELSLVTGDRVTVTATWGGGQTGHSVRWQTRANTGSPWVDMVGVSGLVWSDVIATVSDNGRQVRAVGRLQTASGDVDIASGPLTLRVDARLSAPTFAAASSSFDLTAGQDVSLGATVTGLPSATLQWQRRASDGTWVTLVGQTTATLTLRAVPYADNGSEWRIVASNAAGTAVHHVTLNVRPRAPALSGLTAVPAADGSKVFTVQVDGDPKPTLQWRRKAGGVWIDVLDGVERLYVSSSSLIDWEGQELEVTATSVAGSATSRSTLSSDRPTPTCFADADAGGTQSGLVTNDGWCWLSPRPHGNPLTAVAVSSDGQVRVAVGPLGVIMRSIDAGATWTMVPSDTTLKLNGVTLTEDGRSWVVVGAEGLVLRSSDGGQSWVRASSGTQSHLRSVAPGGGAVLVAVGDNDVGLRSTDGGAHWAPMWPERNDWTLVWSQAYRSPATGALFAVGSDGFVGRLRRSADGGATWQVVAVPNLSSASSMAIDRAGQGYLISDLRMFRTLDDGRTWDFVPGPYGAGLRVVIDSSGTAWVFGGQFVERRAPNGQDWGSIVQSAGVGVIDAAPTPDAYGLQIVGARGLLWRPLDWNEIRGRASYAWESVADSSPDGALLATAGGGIRFSSNGGKSWRGSFAPWASPSMLSSARSLVVVSSSTVLVVGPEGDLLRSTDAGLTWTTEPNLLVSGLYRWGSKLFLSGTQGVMASEDGGATWSPSNAPWGTLVAASPLVAITIDPLQSFSWSLFHRTEDGGRTWAPIHDPALSLGHFFDGAFATPDLGVIVGDYGFIVRTADSGRTWTRVDSGTTERLHRVIFVNSEVGYAVGETVVLQTRDAGMTWRRVAQRLALVRPLPLRSGPNALLLISAEGPTVEAKLNP